MSSSSSTPKKIMQGVIPLILGIIIALITPPEGLNQAAMIYMGIFICAIFWLVFDVIPEHIVVMLAMSAFVIFGVAKLSAAFAPFAQSSVWLVIGAFGISAVIGRVGLLKRISFWILKFFPENFRGQILALFATGLITAPLIPSLTAKASILAPFSATVSDSLGFKKGSNGARGLFAAMWISAGVFGMAFYSGAVPVFTVLGFMPPAEAAKFNWFSWFAGTWVWLVVLAVLSFFSIMILCKPEKESAPVEKGFAKAKLAELGPMSRDEKVAGLLLAVALIGWMTGSWHHIDSGILAVVILCVMAMCGLFSKSDFRNKLSWESIVFIGGVFSLAAQISTLKIDKWLASLMTPILAPIVGNVYLLIPIICITTYLVRAVVISQTATTAIFFATLGGVAQAAGIHPWVILFTVYVSTLVWHFSYTNTTYVAALAATGGEMVNHKDTVPMNFAYMVVNIIACMASIPLWKMMGFM